MPCAPLVALASLLNLAARCAHSCRQAALQPSPPATPLPPRRSTAACSPAKQQMGAPMRIGDGCSFNSFRTSSYKLHFLKLPSALKVGAQGGSEEQGAGACWAACLPSLRVSRTSRTVVLKCWLCLPARDCAATA